MWVIKFLQKNKLPIAMLSLAGSLFGLLFSAADLKDTLEAQNKKKRS